MLPRNDYAYLLKRERECRERAAVSDHPHVRRVHDEFAERYGRAAEELAQRTSSAA